MTDEGQQEPDDPDGRTTAIELTPPVGGTDPGAPARGTAEPDRPHVLLLGSGELAQELTLALRRLGAEVSVADADADGPAHAFAERSLAVALDDAEALSEAVGRLRPDFVATATGSVAGLALESLQGTELVPGARAVRLAGDPERLRRLAADELGLPTAPFWFVGSVGELEAVAAHAGLPLLVKPVAGAPGRGQSVVTKRHDLETVWQGIVGKPLDKPAGEGQYRVLAETLVDVDFFVTLLAVSSQGPRGLQIEFCSPIGHSRAEADVLECWQPQQMSPAALDAARSIAARIVKALGGRGVFGVELMIHGDEVYFADVTTCPRESAWVTLRSQRLSAFELQARAILGLPVDTMMTSPGAARAVSPGAGLPGAGALARALGVPESDARLFGPGPRGGSWVALATAPDVAAARERAREVAGRAHMPDSGR